MVALPTMRETLPRCVTVEEYLAFDENSAVKTEYLNGRIYCHGVPFDPDTEGIDARLWAMAGAMPNHNVVMMNLGAALVYGGRTNECQVYSSDQRILRELTQDYVYPDISVCCDTPVFDTNHKPFALKNPLVVVEVLSPSTRKYDLSDKADAYREIPSLQDILFVSPDDVFVLHYARKNVTTWISTEHTQLSATIHLSAMGCDIALQEIYRTLGF